MKRWNFLFGLCFLLMTAAIVAAQDDLEVRVAVDTPPNTADVALQEVQLLQPDGSAFAMQRPLYITSAGDGTGRLFLVQQGGRILVMNAGDYVVSDFLNLSELVTWDANAGGYTERGLLGLAFHPEYATNGLFYVNYTDRQGTSVVAEYRVSADDPNRADPSSARILLQQPQPFFNHNGGHMDFGPDGYLYISIGDGGSANDPLATGQNPDDWLGSLLRIDVHAAEGYAIPDNNPFVNGGGAPEVWNYGLRNVWRFSFDRATGDLYIADVGQNEWEEVNFQPADSPGGENYGWNAYEGTHVFAQRVSAENAVMPFAEYNHSEGCSVTGGYVYRGEAIPSLQAVYLYSDYCTGTIWMAYRDNALNWQTNAVLLEAGAQVSSFGEDEAGELYIIDYSGRLFKLVPGS